MPAEADWLVGINATRALTCKYNAQLSCGRVQTPTLAHDRQPGGGDLPLCAKALLRDPRPGRQPHPGLEGQKERQRESSFQKERIENILKELSGKQAVVERVKKTPKKTLAPRFTT